MGATPQYIDGYFVKYVATELTLNPTKLCISLCFIRTNTSVADMVDQGVSTLCV